MGKANAPSYVVGSLTFISPPRSLYLRMIEDRESSVPMIGLDLGGTLIDGS